MRVREEDLQSPPALSPTAPRRQRPRTRDPAVEDAILPRTEIQNMHSGFISGNCRAIVLGLCMVVQYRMFFDK